MTGEIIRTSRLECKFCFVQSKGPVLDEVRFVSDTHSCTLDFKWSWAAPTAMRKDVVDFLVNLMARCFPAEGAVDATIETSNFLAQLPGLRFENLNAKRSKDDTGTLTLQLSAGGVQALLSEMEDRKMHAPIEDVFLPLTNLSAYLNIMKDQTDDATTARAVARTAERIDEFLLIYGGRLQDGVHGCVRSGH